MAFQLLRLVLFDRWHWRLAIIFISLTGSIFGLLGPYIQKHFIDSLLMVPSKDIFGFESTLHPLTLIFIAFVCIALALICSFLSNYIGMREALFTQQKLSEKLYEKTLNLRTDSLQGKTVGELVAIYATDVPGAAVLLEQSIPSGAATFSPLLLAPIALYILFELPLDRILAVIGFFILLNTYLAYRQSYFFNRYKQLAAERVGLVNEWILNIKALKIMGWITAYEERIKSTRITETKNRISMVTNGQTMNSLSSTTTFLINIVAIYVLTSSHQNQITPGELLSLLWILGIFLARPFRFLPWFFTFGIDSWTSLKRIASFLDLKNLGRDWPHAVSADESKMETQGPSIEVVNLNLKIGNEILLKNMSFSIKQKEFIAIVGEVGSGKSLLLLSLMGETGASMDQYRINNKNVLSCSHEELCRHFAFVPQESFVMSASLRENIAFDYNINNKLDARITSCLEQAQFHLEENLFPEQLDTEIGERGVNLSGGQKQRVNVARANYYDCPIILMDDSLSALDANTEQQIIDTLIKGHWSHKTRILSTHRLTVLKEVDRIFFLESGLLSAEGSFDELINTSPSFNRFIESLRPKENDVTKA